MRRPHIQWELLARILPARPRQRPGQDDGVWRMPAAGFGPRHFSITA
jgi:hypothetical protein